MVLLKAPQGCKHYSYNGVVHDVPADGIVEVPFEVAQVLHAHGFLPPALADAKVAAADGALLTREELHDMLGNLGFAVADTALPAVKMVEMLKAAVKAKADAVVKANKDLAEGADKAVQDVSGKNQKKNG